jgi:hypothetical protein
MLDNYADWTERARQFLKDLELVSFPAGAVCRVVPSPVYERPCSPSPRTRTRRPSPTR